jgi:hypothetical protein
MIPDDPITGFAFGLISGFFITYLLFYYFSEKIMKILIQELLIEFQKEKEKNTDDAADWWKNGRTEDD